jgi:hypothetical protein
VVAVGEEVLTGTAHSSLRWTGARRIFSLEFKDFQMGSRTDVKMPELKVIPAVCLRLERPLIARTWLDLG